MMIFSCQCMLAHLVAWAKSFSLCSWTDGSSTHFVSVPFQHTASSTSNALEALVTYGKRPIHFCLAVEPLDTNIAFELSQTVTTSCSLKSRRRRVLSLPWLRDSATYVLKGVDCLFGGLPMSTPQYSII